MKPSKKRDAIYDEIKKTILHWHYELGDMLPTEIELSKQYNVSRNTLRGALNKLEEEGLIFRIKGQGTFISKSLARPKIIFLLPHANAILGHQRYCAEFFVGATNASVELNCELETRAVSLTNDPNDINWERLFNLNSSSKVFIYNTWFHKIFPKLCEKKCNVFLIYDKSTESLCEKERQLWHTAENRIDLKAANMTKILLDKNIKKIALIMDNISTSVRELTYKSMQDICDKHNVELTLIILENYKTLAMGKKITSKIVEAGEIQGAIFWCRSEHTSIIKKLSKNIQCGIINMKQCAIDIKHENVYYCDDNLIELGAKAIKTLLEYDLEKEQIEVHTTIRNSLNNQLIKINEEN